MIDPRDITKYDRTESELEELLMFCIIVAGKTASTQAKKLEEFLTMDNLRVSPFQVIAHYWNKNILLQKIQEAKLGQYTKIEKAFLKIILFIDVKTCTVEDLEKIPGIGPKTARFYILHSRPNQRVAVLDTHVLRWMREELDIPTPKSTPTGGRYARLEARFLEHCDEQGKVPADFDLEIWKKYSRK